MAFRDLDLLRMEIAAEFGAFSDADEFMEGVTRDVRRTRRQKLEDWGVVGELAALRATKWNREHPERRQAIANAYARKPEVRAKANAAAKARRAEKPAPVLTCRECGKRFTKRGRRGGTVPEFCRDACRQRFRYQERTDGARRIKRRST